MRPRSVRVCSFEEESDRDSAEKPTKTEGRTIYRPEVLRRVAESLKGYLAFWNEEGEKFRNINAALEYLS